MCVVGAPFLLTVDRNLGRVHIQYRPRGPLLSFGLCNQSPAHGRKPVEVRSLRQHLSLKLMEPRGQGRTAVANLLRANQAKGGPWGKRSASLRSP